MISQLLKPAVKEFIKEHAQDDPAHVSLKYQDIDGADIKHIVDQIIARQKAAKKFPSWAEDYDIIFPGYIAVEQASSLVAAEYKASLFSGKLAIDITGGLGIDTLAFSSTFQKVIYVEADPVKAEVAKYNFSVMGKNNIEVVHSSAEDFLAANKLPADLVYADPDRRPGKERVLTLEESIPDIVALQEVLINTAENVLVKTSPMLDISATLELLPSVKNVYIVGVQNEVKELLFHMRSDNGKAIKLTAASYTAKEWQKYSKIYPPEHDIKVSLPKQFIYEPGSTILKAGLQDVMAKEDNLEKLHPSTQLFTADHLVDSFKGRRFKLIEVLPVNKKLLKQRLPEMKANLSTRNFPEHVDKLKKKLQIKDGGNYYLIGCRLADLSYRLLLTEKI